MPPSDQWRRAPYFDGKGDPFWQKVESYNAMGSELDDVFCIHPEVPLEDGDMVPPSSVLHLDLEMGTSLTLWSNIFPSLYPSLAGASG